MNGEKRCCRCLLQDMADEKDLYQRVIRYRAELPSQKRCSDEVYADRLQQCRACEHLNAATCMQCGCYVEMRAARKDIHCPLRGHW